MLEDRLLVWRFNRGDRDVLRRVYEKYKDELLTLAGALLYDVSSAEDVVHDIFVMFIKSAKKFRLTGSLKAYLATCVANNARNRNMAMRRRRSSGLDEANAIATDEKGPDGAAMFGEQLRQLSWALSELSYEQREVVVLRAYNGMKFKAIAVLQGESINTVQGRYRYGLKKLRSILDGEVKDEAGR